jgi:RNA polymerase sigma-70 factor (ECF subfamily)
MRTAVTSGCPPHDHRDDMTDEHRATTSIPVLGADLGRLRALLHRYCARMVGSVLEGEDIVQQALLQALEAAPAGPPMQNPDGWLFRIAHNAALDFLRRRARRDHLHSPDHDIDSMVHPVDELARREAAAASLPRFMALPPSQRSAVILCDVLEYSAEEAGEILGMTVPALKSALQRGRARLRTLAREPEAPQTRAELSAGQRALLTSYVTLFNARDFDSLRDMLADDVRLDLVNRVKLQGAAVKEYYTRYGEAGGWHAEPGMVEGQPAVLISWDAGSAPRPDHFIVLAWAADRVTSIRDFLFASYAADGARTSRLDSRL